MYFPIPATTTSADYLATKILIFDFLLQKSAVLLHIHRTIVCTSFQNHQGMYSFYMFVFLIMMK
jgi:hypothetical protein